MRSLSLVVLSLFGSSLKADHGPPHVDEHHGEPHVDGHSHPHEHGDWAGIDSFGFSTISHAKASTNGSVTVALLWEGWKFECDHAEPQNGSLYTCSKTEWLACKDTENEDLFMMMVENPSNNALIIENFIVNTTDGEWFGIHGACYSYIDDSNTSVPAGSLAFASDKPGVCGIGTKWLDTFCVDSEAGDCNPGVQAWSFDIEREGQYILNAAYEAPESGVTAAGQCETTANYGTVDSFGFTVSADSEGITDTKMTVELYWANKVYECDFENLEAGEEAECNDGIWRECDNDEATEDLYEILISNDNDAAIVISDFHVETTTNLYTIDAACYASDDVPKRQTEDATEGSSDCASGELQLQNFCVNSKEDDCFPSRQSWKFDLTMPGKYIQDSGYESGADKADVCADSDAEGAASHFAPQFAVAVVIAVFSALY